MLNTYPRFDTSKVEEFRMVLPYKVTRNYYYIYYEKQNIEVCFKYTYEYSLLYKRNWKYVNRRT